MNPDDPMEMEWQQMLASVDRMRQFYGGQRATEVWNQIADRASGVAAPFTPLVRGNMLADNSDAVAGQFASEQDFVLQRMANQGLSGSGGETQAIINARRRAQANMQQGRRDIQTRTELANFQAKAEAQREATAFLEQQNKAQALAEQQEIALRSQRRDVQREGEGQAAAAPDPNVDALRQKYAGVNPYTQAIGRLGGVAASNHVPTMYVGGSTHYQPQGWGFGGSGGYQTKEQAQQAYDAKLYSLQSQAQAWDQQKMAFQQQYGF